VLIIKRFNRVTNCIIRHFYQVW